MDKLKVIGLPLLLILLAGMVIIRLEKLIGQFLLILWAIDFALLICFLE